MGNTTSKTNKKSLEHVVNYLAAQYITKDEFKNMSNLNNPEYCNELIILTSKIFKEYLNPKVIEYLAVKKGVEGENIMTKDQIIAIQKGNLDKINVKDGIKRERLCIGLAKFYIQIGHIFSAVSSTLNPQYQFKDEDGNLTEQSITDREGLPGSSERIITRNNLCSNRLKILLGNIDYNDLLDEEIIKINPNFCDSNGTTGDKTLNMEPGIPELEELYFDQYNYNIAKFDSMSDEMKKVYDNDVKSLYEAFSDGEEKFDSDNIKSFSDIKLKDFYNASGCSSGKFNNPVVGSSKSGLFKKYANNIKKMIENIKLQNDKLLKILDQIFVFSIDSSTGNKKVSINPTLNNEKLKNITKETKDTIIELYSGCENNFIEGLKIYEAIVRNQQFKTTKAQINNLKSEVGEKLPELKDDLNNLSTISDKSPSLISDTNEEDPTQETTEDPTQETTQETTEDSAQEQAQETTEDSAQEQAQETTEEKQENKSDETNSTSLKEITSEQDQTPIKTDTPETLDKQDDVERKSEEGDVIEKMITSVQNKTSFTPKKVIEESANSESYYKPQSTLKTQQLDKKETIMTNKREPTLSDKIKMYKTEK